MNSHLDYFSSEVELYKNKIKSEKSEREKKHTWLEVSEVFLYIGAPTLGGNARVPKSDGMGSALGVYQNDREDVDKSLGNNEKPKRETEWFVIGGNI